MPTNLSLDVKSGNVFMNTKMFGELITVQKDIINLFVTLIMMKICVQNVKEVKPVKKSLLMLMIFWLH